jgi:hypothetical protein
MLLRALKALLLSQDQQEWKKQKKHQQQRNKQQQQEQPKLNRGPIFTILSYVHDCNGIRLKALLFRGL